MLLAAETPAEFLATHFAGYFRPHFADRSAERPHSALTLRELLANDASALRALHARMVAKGSPPPAAATYLSGWFGGIAAGALAYSWVASAGVGFLPSPGAMRWYFHPDGWTDRAEFLEPVATLVPAGHAWAGRPDVTVVDDAAERAARTMSALVTAVTPIVDALLPLSNVKRTNLWHEVVDGAAAALVYQVRLPVTEEGVAGIRSLCDYEGAPWRRRPVVERIETWYGAVCTMQKAGCCLAYTENHDDHDDHEDDADHHLFHQLFRDSPGAPAYCANCRLRPKDECVTQQLWWREREYMHRAGLIDA